MQNAIGEKSPSTGKLIKHKSEQLSRWAWQTREMQLPNKIIAELIYNANTKGPRSETRGPAIGGSGPGSHRSKVAIGHSDPCRWSTDRGPSKTNQPQLSSGNTIIRTKMRAIWTVDRGSWSPVPGPGQGGSGTPGPVLCSRMGSALSLDKAAN